MHGDDYIKLYSNKIQTQRQSNLNGKDVYLFHPFIRFARDVMLVLLLLKEDKEASN